MLVRDCRGTGSFTRFVPLTQKNVCYGHGSTTMKNALEFRSTSSLLAVGSNKKRRVPEQVVKARS